MGDAWKTGILGRAGEDRMARYENGQTEFSILGLGGKSQGPSQPQCSTGNLPILKLGLARRERLRPPPALTDFSEMSAATARGVD